MNRITRRLFAVALAGAVSFAPIPFAASQPVVTTVYAHGHHSGGGHHGSNGYQGGHHSDESDIHYYYCNGHDAHQHTNGICPYASSDTSGSVSKKTIKKVQKRLNHLGYHCGKANGVLSSKTKKALRKFQRECSLEANGTIQQSTLNALGL